MLRFVTLPHTLSRTFGYINADGKSCIGARRRNIRGNDPATAVGRSAHSPAGVAAFTAAANQRAKNARRARTCADVRRVIAQLSPGTAEQAESLIADIRSRR